MRRNTSVERGVSSFVVIGGCITTNRLLDLKFKRENYKLSHIKALYILETEYVWYFECLRV